LALEDKDSIDVRALSRPTFSGCLIVLLSATGSCLLLFLNGGVTMAFINLLNESGYTLVRDDRISQFAVLVGPVILLIIQWWMIDYLRVHLRRRQPS
jgi:hypothetical protein